MNVKQLNTLAAQISKLNMQAARLSSEAIHRFTTILVVALWDSTPEGALGINEFRLQFSKYWTICGFGEDVGTMKSRLSEFIRVLSQYDSAALVKKVDQIISKRTDGQSPKSAFTAIREIASAAAPTSKDSTVVKSKTTKKSSTVKSKAVGGSKPKKQETAPTASAVQGHATKVDDPLDKALAPLRKAILVYTATRGSDQKWLDSTLLSWRDVILAKVAQLDAQNGIQVVNGETHKATIVPKQKTAVGQK